MEKILKPMSGYLALIINLAVLAVCDLVICNRIQSFDRGEMVAFKLLSQSSVSLPLYFL